MTDGPLAGVLGPASQLGRYFSIVGGVPSLILTAFPAALFAAGAPGRRPRLASLGVAFKELNLSDVGLLAIAVVVIGLALQPVQFALTQLLEGYWGSGRGGRRAMTRSTTVHLRKMLVLEELADESDDELHLRDEEIGVLRDLEARTGERSSGPDQLSALLVSSVPARTAAQQYRKKLSRYPTYPEEVMPTRLGNVLRRHERFAGAAYGLDPISVTGMLVQVVDDTLRDYHDDARSELDLATRMVFVWVFCTAVGLSLLWRYDVWLLVPLVASLMSFFAYRGSVEAAEAYGEALTVLLALGRGSLYEALGLPSPQDSSEELQQNRELMRQISGEPATLDYRNRKESPLVGPGGRPLRVR
jgi:hypothetical protein